MISKENYVESGELLAGQYTIKYVQSSGSDEIVIRIEYKVKATGRVLDINEESFPDPFFRDYVKTLPGAEDGKFTKQELADITLLNLQGNNQPVLYSLEGIEHFKNLQTLTICDTELESIDLSKIKNLVTLSLKGNNFKYLDVSDNPKLVNLSCLDEQLVSLDVSKNVNLETFKVENNKCGFVDGVLLSELPGFDKSKVSNIQGGNFDGNKVNFTSKTITYTYNCGNGKSATFTLEKLKGADYTVKHFQQQLDGTYVEITADRQTLVGVLGDKTKGIANTYEGFTAQEIDQKTISNDGTIVEIKYDRNVHRVTWAFGDGTSSSVSEIVMFGEPIEPRDIHWLGHNLVGWNPAVAETMPDHDVTYVALWEEIHYHDLTLKKGKAATCTEDGYKDYYECECGKYFEDDKATKEIDNLETWKKGDGKLAKLGHTYHSIDGMEATCQNEGLKSYLKCDTCGKAFDPNTKKEITNLDEWRKISKLEHNLKMIERVEPTQDKEGIKEYYQCEMCKKYYSDAQGKNEINDLESWKNGAGKLEKLSAYQIIEGMNSKWNKDSNTGLTFKSDGKFEELIGIAIDGVMIDKKEYTAKEGSTIVTLNLAYLETLKLGKHTFDMVYADGICGTSFEVTNIEKPEVKPEVPSKPATKPDVTNKVPQTGDNSNVMLWTLFGIVSLASAAALMQSKKKNRSTK